MGTLGRLSDPEGCRFGRDIVLNGVVWSLARGVVTERRQRDAKVATNVETAMNRSCYRGERPPRVLCVQSAIERKNQPCNVSLANDAGGDCCTMGRQRSESLLTAGIQRCGWATRVSWKAVASIFLVGIRSRGAMAWFTKSACHHRGRELLETSRHTY
jgi:hypothetical protein